MHIYIHFPYCLYKCHYCDFNSYATDAQDIPSHSYTSVLVEELSWRLQNFEKEEKLALSPGSVVESIFFGGGTPSLMRPQDVERLLAEIQQNYQVSSNVEITLESNPGTLSKNLLLDFKSAGVNRVSLGVQSLQDKNLKRFGRIHTASEALVALDSVLDVFGEWTSCDLIFGFPEQTLHEWICDLKQILSKNLCHLSCYALTAESGTIYSRDLNRGVWDSPDEDVVAQMFLMTREMTDAVGLHAYEISNFARRGHESKHNLGYWKYHEFMGLGAGAFGQYRLKSKEGFWQRTENLKSPEAYQKNVKSGLFFSVEEISKRTAQVEFMMMGLRLTEGIAEKDFENLFHQKIDDVFGDALRSTKLAREQRRIFVRQNDQLRLNEIVREFFA